MKQWEQSQAHELTKIRAAQRHLIYNVVAYLAISILEYWLAAISQSQTLRADAFNNLSGIISTVLLMMGLHIAQDINDNDILREPNFRTASTRRCWVGTNGFSLFAGAMKRSSPWLRR